MSDAEMGTGVYYHAGDYVPLSRRWMILFVDLIVVYALWFSVAGTFSLMEAADFRPFAWAFTGLVWCYLALLKSLTGRTLGYRLVKARIVNIDGTCPSAFRLTFRLIITFFGIGSPLLDLIWMNLGDHSQTLRDKLAGTYVVYADRKPAGNGPIRHSRMFVMSYAFMFREVSPESVRNTKRQ
jgi:uncharacterized RDD family membrane protein YckC